MYSGTRLSINPRAEHGFLASPGDSIQNMQSYLCIYNLHPISSLLHENILGWWYEELAQRDVPPVQQTEISHDGRSLISMKSHGNL